MRSQAKDQIDLFSGIGGFALAARWAGFETVQFVELDPFCQKVLNKNFPGVPIHDDIKTFTYTDIYKSGTQSRNDEEMRGFPKEECESGHSSTLLRGSDSREQPIPTTTNKFRPTPFILTGGFPCQPFSCAGKRKGKEDDRYLWPEMLRVISEARPTWVIGENVGGFVNMGLDECISDLEAEGYEVQPFIIPACAKNAPHRRDRVWICAHSVNSTDRTIGRQVSEEDGIQGINREKVGSGMSSGTDSHAPDTTINGLHNIRTEGRVQERPFNSIDSRSIGWNEPWLEAATRLCRVDARVSGRVDRLKSLGNAIVPQIAYEIMKAIKEIEEGEK